jgi:hypothetical protein
VQPRQQVDFPTHTRPIPPVLAEPHRRASAGNPTSAGNSCARPDKLSPAPFNAGRIALLTAELETLKKGKPCSLREGPDLPPAIDDTNLPGLEAIPGPVQEPGTSTDPPGSGSSQDSQHMGSGKPQGPIVGLLGPVADNPGCWPARSGGRRGRPRLQCRQKRGRSQQQARRAFGNIAQPNADRGPPSSVLQEPATPAGPGLGEPSPCFFAFIPGCQKAAGFGVDLRPERTIACSSVGDTHQAKQLRCQSQERICRSAIREMVSASCALRRSIHSPSSSSGLQVEIGLAKK